MTTSIYQRVKSPDPMILTGRDEAIIRAVGRFRFLRGDQVVKLMEGSKQGILRRLGKLFHHGYLTRLDRTTVQISMPGYKGVVYGLGFNGRKYLTSQGVFYSYRQHEKKPKILYLSHTLKIADFVIDLTKSLPSEVDLYHHDEFRVLFSEKESVSWNLPIFFHGKEVSVGLIPDYVFALVRGDETCVFCLEVDRGTMPVERKRSDQSSFYRKLLTYQETWKTGFAAKNFDWKRFRVVTVTSSEKRNNHLIHTCKKVCKRGGGEKLFLFSCEDAVRASGDLYRHRWNTGKGYEDVLLS